MRHIADRAAAVRACDPRRSSRRRVTYLSLSDGDPGGHPGIAVGIGRRRWTDHLYTRMDDRDAQAVMRAVLDAGIGYFDTAPHYGPGLSERHVGDALLKVTRERTGCADADPLGEGRARSKSRSIDQGRRGMRGFFSPMPFKRRYDYSYDGMMQSWEDSLDKLGLASVDILYVHDIGEKTHGKDHPRR